jgi:hypothetical protein
MKGFTVRSASSEQYAVEVKNAYVTILDEFSQWVTVVEGREKYNLRANYFVYGSSVNVRAIQPIDRGTIEVQLDDEPATPVDVILDAVKALERFKDVIA